MAHRCTWIVCLLSVVAMATACGDTPDATTHLRLATTTSTENSGLLDDLLPRFEAATGIRVAVLPMGTGKALATGSRGDCDVLLVHAPAAEEAFLAEGHARERHAVMHNDFVILGPSADPLGLAQLNLPNALRTLAAGDVVFCSRGDDSGTHKKELALWRDAGVAPEQASFRYLETGQGMGGTLIQANERQAHTLTDRGTYLAFRGRLDLTVLVEDSALLRNPYSVMALDPDRHPHVRHAAAEKFIAWLCGPAGQRAIGAFRIADQVLFHPATGP